MEYLLQIYSDEVEERFKLLSEDEQKAMVDEFRAIYEIPGVISGKRLQPVDTATTVCAPNGEMLLTDGPFVDAKEHLGGFFLVDVEDLDAAIEIAARIPAARMGGAIEVRPVKAR